MKGTFHDLSEGCSGFLKLMLGFGFRTCNSRSYWFQTLLITRSELEKEFNNENMKRRYVRRWQDVRSRVDRSCASQDKSLCCPRIFVVKFARYQ